MSEKLDAIEPARALLDEFAGALGQVLESMAEQRPETTWKAVSGTVAEVTGPQDEILWWEQPLQFAPDMKIWVGSPRTAWEQAGTLTLKAAGLDTVESGEAKNTWLEILVQSLSSVARAIGETLGREVGCEAGAERAPEAGIREWASFSLSFKDAPLAPLLAAFSPALLEALTASNRPEERESERETELMAAEPPAAETALSPARSRTMSLLLDVDLPVSISFGKTQLPMKDVIKLTTGSIVELNRGVNEPVEVLVNQTLIARGEVVVVEGNYGVRILEIATRHERLRTIR
jgi:flagellar motor switch protein FliN/FliY